MDIRGPQVFCQVSKYIQLLKDRTYCVLTYFDFNTEIKMALKMFFKTVILSKIPYFVYPIFDGYLDRVRVRVKGSGTRGFGYRVTRELHPSGT